MKLVYFGLSLLLLCSNSRAQGLYISKSWPASNEQVKLGESNSIIYIFRAKDSIEKGNHLYIRTAWEGQPFPAFKLGDSAHVDDLAPNQEFVFGFRDIFVPSNLGAVGQTVTLRVLAHAGTDPAVADTSYIDFKLSEKFQRDIRVLSVKSTVGDNIAKWEDLEIQVEIENVGASPYPMGAKTNFYQHFKQYGFTKAGNFYSYDSIYTLEPKEKKTIVYRPNYNIIRSSLPDSGDMELCLRMDWRQKVTDSFNFNTVVDNNKENNTACLEIFINPSLSIAKKNKKTFSIQLDHRQLFLQAQLAQSQNVSILIYSMGGKPVLQQHFVANVGTVQSYSLDHLSAGVYQGVILNDNRIAQRFKVLLP